MMYDTLPQSRTDFVLGLVRERILAGRYPPGSPLVEAELAAEFQVSKTPVREALKLLAGSGLVVMSNYRGASVRAVTVDLVREVYDLRALLEPEALARSVAAGVDFTAARKELAAAGADPSRDADDRAQEATAGPAREASPGTAGPSREASPSTAGHTREGSPDAGSQAQEAVPDVSGDVPEASPDAGAYTPAALMKAAAARTEAALRAAEARQLSDEASRNAGGGTRKAAQAGGRAQEVPQAGDHARRSLANRRFHRHLYAGCGNALLVQVLDDLADRTALISVTGWAARPSWNYEAMQHSAILDAAEERDAARAAELLGLHITGFAKAFEEVFRAE
jgi:DNA-binding GntR family transcriptional regulator